MNNTLIYLEEDALTPKGGPLGYNYNLNKQLKELSCKNVSFIPSLGRKKGKSYILRRYLPKSLVETILITLRIFKRYREKNRSSHKSRINLTKYDIVHFHDTRSLYNVRDSLNDYKGVVLLTSHSPTLLSNEIWDMLSSFEKKFCKRLYRDLLEMDRYSFNRADYIIFPCPEAEQPYESWPEFRKIKESHPEKFKYLLTGINPCRAKLSRNEICERYAIPKDAFIICYVGRHNEIKGFNDLKKIGLSLLNAHPNIYFIVAGAEAPIKGLNHPRWIEVGWTNDPHSLMKSSNVFILPNKETYFDLIMLENLSLGNIVIASNTGGNRYFNDCDGILLYNSIEEAIKKVESIFNKSKEECELLSASNVELFNKKFNSRQFALNYLSLIEQL